MPVPARKIDQVAAELADPGTRKHDLFLASPRRDVESAYTRGELDEPRFYDLMGIIYYYQDDTEAALSNANAAVARDPQPLHVNNLAVYLMRDGRHEDAIPLLEDALAAAGPHVILLANLSEALAECGEWERARSVLQQGLDAADAASSLDMWALAMGSVRVGQYDLARMLFARYFALRDGGGRLSEAEADPLTFLMEAPNSWLSCLPDETEAAVMAAVGRGSILRGIGAPPAAVPETSSIGDDVPEAYWDYAELRRRATACGMGDGE